MTDAQLLQNGGTQGSPVDPLLHTTLWPSASRAALGQSPAPPNYTNAQSSTGEGLS
jgi:hypothetical protein